MIAYVVALLAFLSFLYQCHWRVNKKSPIINWPVLGMLPGALWNSSRIHDYAADMLKQSRGTFEFRGPWFLNSSFWVTSDLANVQHIFSKNPSNYINRGDEFREIYEILGDGVFTSDGEVWKTHRTVILSIIRHNRFTNFLVKTVQQKMENDLIPMLEYFSEGGVEFDMQEIIHRFTFDNICSLVLGFDPKSLSLDFPRVECEKALHDAELAAFRRNMYPRCFWKLQQWLNIGMEKKYTISGKAFDKLLYQTISQKRRQLSASKNQMKQDKEDGNFDMLTAYIVEEMKNNRSSAELKKSDKFLRDNAFNMMAAGRDALSASLTWFFGLIATYPAVQSRILEEIKANVKVKDVGKGKMMFLNIEELSKLHYFHASICETMRIFPPVPFMPKSAIEPEMLPSGHRIDKNEKILVSIYGMGRMESIWGKDCMEFKPERWLSERGEVVPVPTYKSMGFGSGPRSCIGKDISLLQMKMVATAVIMNYHIQLTEGHRLFPCNSIVLHMEHGLKVKFSKRCF